MEKKDTTIYLKKKIKYYKNIKKIIARQKSLNIIMNKQFFNYDLIAYAVIQLYI